MSNNKLSYCNIAANINTAHLTEAAACLSHHIALLTRRSDIVLLLQPLR